MEKVLLSVCATCKRYNTYICIYAIIICCDMLLYNVHICSVGDSLVSVFIYDLWRKAEILPPPPKKKIRIAFSGVMVASPVVLY
jgi:hypothetical protein